MDFKELDSQFDATLNRLKNQTGPLAGAPPGTPFADDHYMLQKSWDYFRARLKEVDEQWHGILAAKEKEIEALHGEAALMKGRLEELENENLAQRQFEELVKKSRAEDHISFRRDTEKLRDAWEAEREVTERAISHLQYKVEQAEKAAKTRAEAFEKRERELLTVIESLRKESSRQVDHEYQTQREASGRVLQRDDEIRGLQSKIALLQAELERGADLLKKQAEKTDDKTKEISGLAAELEELKKTLLDKDRQLEHIRMSVDILEREKTALRERWNQEKAEWRELWERAREVWEKKRRVDTP